MDFIIGKNPVIEALKSEREINKIWIAEGVQRNSIQPIIQLAKQNGVLVQYVPKKKLDQMVEGAHQGVVAQVAAYRYYEVMIYLREHPKKTNRHFFSFLMNWKIHIT